MSVKFMPLRLLTDMPSIWRLLYARFSRIVSYRLPGRFLQKDADHEGDPLFTLAVKSTKMRAILAFRRLEPCHEPSS